MQWFDTPKLGLKNFKKLGQNGYQDICRQAACLNFVHCTVSRTYVLIAVTFCRKCCRDQAPL